MATANGSVVKPVRTAVDSFERVELPKTVNRKVPFCCVPERKEYHPSETEVVRVVTKHQIIEIEKTDFTGYETLTCLVSAWREPVVKRAS